MTIQGTKWEKISHYVKVVVITSLVFTAVGGIAYGKYQIEKTELQKQVLQEKIVTLQNQVKGLENGLNTVTQNLK